VVVPSRTLICLILELGSFYHYFGSATASQDAILPHPANLSNRPPLQLRIDLNDRTLESALIRMADYLMPAIRVDCLAIASGTIFESSVSTPAKAVARQNHSVAPDPSLVAELVLLYPMFHNRPDPPLRLIRFLGGCIRQK
jgi:hypothetical protein